MSMSQLVPILLWINMKVKDFHQLEIEEVTTLDFPVINTILLILQNIEGKLLYTNVLIEIL